MVINFTPQATHASNHPVDWDAYQILQEQSFKTDDAFITEVIDCALNKLLETHQRAAVGRQLAKDLFRDAKRSVTLRNKISGKYFQSSLYFTELFCGNDIIVNGPPQIQHSINTVSKAINKLPVKEKDALILRLTGQDNETVIANKLGVGIRQYRNLLGSCKDTLRSTPGFKDACEELQFLEKSEEDYNIFSMLKQLSINAAIAA